MYRSPQSYLSQALEVYTKTRQVQMSD
uniref:Uncharacterized protein n=1 Tax=Anguilla anguilla TaxID=7936 RepID=A0A0E9XV98_ANGAN